MPAIKAKRPISNMTKKSSYVEMVNDGTREGTSPTGEHKEPSFGGTSEARHRSGHKEGDGSGHKEGDGSGDKEGDEPQKGSEAPKKSFGDYFKVRFIHLPFPFCSLLFYCRMQICEQHHYAFSWLSFCQLSFSSSQFKMQLCTCNII